MPPPPSVTPSPYRFVTKKEPAARKPVTTKAIAPSHNLPRNTRQFNATPRFHFSSASTQSKTQSYPATASSAPRYLAPASNTPKAQGQDVIDTLSDDGLHAVDDFTETDISEHSWEYKPTAADVDDDYAIEAGNAKRRRLSPSPAREGQHSDEDEASDHEDSISSSLPIIPSPLAASHRAIPAAASRFLIPALSSTLATSTASQSAFRKPPAFRPPDPAETPQSHGVPLPEHFSPHRKGRRYIPGGLASKLQGWLFDVQSTVSPRADHSREDPWLVKMVVSEVNGSAAAGMTLVSGRRIHVGGRERMSDNLGIVRVILAGEGEGIGLQKGRKCEVGRTVGIKGPVWEVNLEGVKWGVGVDWKVLPD